MQRTGPRTGTQNCRSRLNKFKAFIEILANFFDSQSDISTGFKVNSNTLDVFKEKLEFFQEKIGGKYWQLKLVVLDLFSIRFSAIFDADNLDLFKFCWGRTKPLYEAPDFNCNQIGQSGHQSEDNFILKSNLVSSQFNF